MAGQCLPVTPHRVHGHSFVEEVSDGSLHLLADFDCLGAGEVTVPSLLVVHGGAVVLDLQVAGGPGGVLLDVGLREHMLEDLGGPVGLGKTASRSAVDHFELDFLVARSHLLHLRWNLLWLA